MAKVTMDEIEAMGRTISEEFHPRQVVLFGSYARGTASDESDVDLLVVLPELEKPIDKAVEIRMALPRSIPVDVLVRSPEKVRERIELGDFFMQDVFREGVRLYEDTDV